MVDHCQLSPHMNNTTRCASAYTNTCISPLTQGVPEKSKPTKCFRKLLLLIQFQYKMKHKLAAKFHFSPDGYFLHNIWTVAMATRLNFILNIEIMVKWCDFRPSVQIESTSGLTSYMGLQTSSHSFWPGPLVCIFLSHFINKFLSYDLENYFFFIH